MLDFADVVAINKFERRGARGRPPRRRPPARAQPRGVRRDLGGHAGVRHERRHVQRRRRHRALPAPARAARRGRAHRRRGAAAAHRPQDLQRLRRRDPAAAGALPRRDRRDRPRLPRGHRPAPSTPRGSASTCAPPASWSATRSPRPWSRPRRRSRPSRRRAARRWPQVVEDYSGDELVVRVRDKELRTALTRETLSGNKVPPGRAAPVHRGRRAAALPAHGEPAGPVPVHGGRVRVQARRRGPGAHVRRRGRRVPHQPPVQAALGRTPRPSASPRRSTR